MRAMRSLPGTLLFQVSGILAATVGIALSVSCLVYLEGAEAERRAITTEQALARTAAVARVAASVPAGIRADAAESASGGAIRFWLSRQAEVPSEATGAGSGALRQRLAALVQPSGEATAGDAGVRIELRHPGDDTAGGIAATTGEADLRLGDTGLTASVQIGPQTWLNAATYTRERRSAWSAVFAVVLGITTVALIGAVLLVARRIAEPLRHLAEAAERLGRGEAVAELVEHGPQEVRRAARAFNQMQGRLRRFVEDRTRMLAAISHDLRTPIATLRLRAEEIDDDEAREGVLRPLEELSALAEATLAFAREEGAEEARKADLASLVESVASDLAELGRAVIFEDAPRTPLVCRASSLRRAVRNLIENAVAYGGSAQVSLRPDPERRGHVQLVVDDQGPGIPEAELERVFEPFVRLEASRNRRTGGTGLGLSIVRSVARAHGGDAAVENRPGGGLRATLSLPLPKGSSEDRQGRRIGRLALGWAGPGGARGGGPARSPHRPDGDALVPERMAR